MKEIAEKDFETEVLAPALPVVLDFYGAESKAFEARRVHVRDGRPQDEGRRW